MNEKDRQAIIKTLEAIASTLSFCETNMEFIFHDKLNMVYKAIDELKNNAQ